MASASAPRGAAAWAERPTPGAGKTYSLPALAGLLLINPRSGDASPGPDELKAAAERAGVETHVLIDQDDPGALARDASADALGIAGGDGSLAAIATAAVERRLPFVVVPFGTGNHFARDVG